MLDMMDKEDKLRQLEIVYYGLVENFNFWKARKTTDLAAYRQARGEKEECWKQIVSLRKKLLWPKRR